MRPPKTRTIRGTVLGPDGKPFSGATVFWVGQRKPPVPFVAMPKDRETRRLHRTDVLARAASDAERHVLPQRRFRSRALSFATTAGM